MVTDDCGNGAPPLSWSGFAGWWTLDAKIACRSNKVFCEKNVKKHEISPYNWFFGLLARFSADVSMMS